MRVGIFYGSTTKVTKNIVEKIGKELKIAENSILDIEDIERGHLEEKILNYELIILATPTYQLGDVQKSWEKHLKELGEIDFNNRDVALVGIGNQERFANSFVSGMGILYYYIKNNNIKLIGKTSVKGYEFNLSTAIDGDKFYGLVIDEKNQKGLTDERIIRWVSQIQEEFRD